MSKEELTGRPLNIAVLTVSDTRTFETDKGGDTVAALLGEEGHRVVARRIVKDDEAAISSALAEWLSGAGVDAATVDTAAMDTAAMDVAAVDTTAMDAAAVATAGMEAAADEGGVPAALDAIITTGGTGIARRDVTIEAVSALLEKEIPGFGELFRYLSYTEDIGTRAMASRAVAGTVQGILVFALPGSTGAVTLGLTKLILPELRHMANEVRK